MTCPAFRLAAANSAVTALLGTAPVRFYPFGEAEEAVVKPYAVWQLAYGSPYNLINDIPREDSFGTQIDCYALTSDESRAVAEALQNAFERDGYITSFNGEFRESDTRLFRVSFTVEFIQPREQQS